MQKPNEMTCLLKAHGCEAYRIDGRVRVFRTWHSYRAGKADMEVTAAEFSYLSPEHAK